MTNVESYHMNGTIDDTSMHTALLDVPLHSGFWGGGGRGKTHKHSAVRGSHAKC